MVSLVKNPDLFGGQGAAKNPRLCYDCKHRPIEFTRRPKPDGVKACDMFVGPTSRDPLAARDLCKGEFWEGPEGGARGD